MTARRSGATPTDPVLEYASDPAQLRGDHRRLRRPRPRPDRARTGATCTPTRCRDVDPLARCSGFRRRIDDRTEGLRGPDSGQLRRGRLRAGLRRHLLGAVSRFVDGTPDRLLARCRRRPSRRPGRSAVRSSRAAPATTRCAADPAARTWSGVDGDDKLRGDGGDDCVERRRGRRPAARRRGTRPDQGRVRAATGSPPRTARATRSRAARAGRGRRRSQGRLRGVRARDRSRPASPSYTPPTMTLVVKLGSSIVAGADGALRADVLDDVCAQVAELHDGGRGGASWSPRARSPAAGGCSACERRPTRGRRAAGGLGRRPGHRSSAPTRTGSPAASVRAAQVLLTAFDMSERIHYLNARQTLQRLLAWHVVPVINENDTTATDEITFGDNDFLSAQVAIMVEARRLILLTDQEGLHTRRPAPGPERGADREVDDTGELDALRDRRRAPRAFGSGGMRSKVVAAQMASGSGIAVTICNGTRERHAAGAPRAASASARSFRAGGGRAPSFKLWLRWAAPARGRVDGRRGRRARAARAAAPRCCRSASSGSRAASPPAIRSRSSARTADRRQGHRRALLGGARAAARQAQRRGRRDPARRRRGGHPPGPLRADVDPLAGSRRLSLLAWRSRPNPSLDLCRRAPRGLARPAVVPHRGEGRGAADRRALLRERTARDPRGERDRRRARPRGRARRGAARPAHASTPSGSRRWPSGVEAIVALPDPVGEVDRASDARQRASSSSTRACRSASSRSSTRRGPTSPIDAAALCLKSGNAACCAARAPPPRRTPCSAGSSARRSPRPACPRARSSSSPAAVASELAELAGRSEHRRPDHPPRRRRPEGRARAGRARCRSSTRRPATATSTCTPTPTSRWPGGSSSTRRCSGRASATPPRPCSSTATSPRLPARGAGRAARGRRRAGRRRRGAALGRRRSRSARRPTRTGTPSTTR